MVLEHPMVLHALETLGGELVEIKRIEEDRPEQGGEKEVPRGPKVRV
jgi:hypothetical protein